ncbi:MAG: DUF2975 domain-containing protein [Burkholderiales bacterium]|nr:DUF2975 domain-containing protein [Burkholderiales bacterium]
MLRSVLLIFLVLQVGFFVLAWVAATPFQLGPWAMQIVPDGMTLDARQMMPTSQRLLGIAVGLPPIVLLIFGMLKLEQTLRQFQRGAIFAKRTIAYLRAFAGATFLSVIFANVEKPLRAMVFNLASNSKAYSITFDITSNEILLILVCGLFYLIAWIMHEGRRLAEENEGFI